MIAGIEWVTPLTIFIYFDTMLSGFRVEEGCIMRGIQGLEVCSEGRAHLV
jgi:hypothetical protein